MQVAQLVSLRWKPQSVGKPRLTDGSRSARHLNLQPAAIFAALFAPQSGSEDRRRREFMVNVLLSAWVVLSAIKLTYLLLDPEGLGYERQKGSLVTNAAFLLIALSLWYMSRKGRDRLGAYCLIAILTLEAIRLTIQWSFELPATELMYALVVTVAGILLTARMALLVSSSAVFMLLLISYDQISDHLQPRTNWLSQSSQMSDAIGCFGVFGIIILVSWLTNREISSSIAKIKASETALALERDTLEAKVTERTNELIEAQLMRTLELQRFAEFGRLSASFIHEVSNPLTAVSLHLEQAGVSDNRATASITQARRSLLQMERYLEAARRQLASRSNQSVFSVNEELGQIKCVLNPLARQAGIKLVLSSRRDYRLYGDPVKFDQLVTNLVANAIDAYEPAHTGLTGVQCVEVRLSHAGETLMLRVRDWGTGISVARLPHLFEPFYTSKGRDRRGLGIGLTVVKRIVEDEFHGTIEVASSVGQGTTFLIDLPLDSAYNRSRLRSSR